MHHAPPARDPRGIIASCLLNPLLGAGTDPSTKLRLPLELRPFAGQKDPESMGIIVQKFGGTSVANAERIHKAALKVIAAKKAGR